MSHTTSSLYPEVVPDFAVRHADRWCRLRDERRFRVEQIAALEAERAAGQRPENVTLALSMAATTALRQIDAALDRMAEGRYGRCVSCAQAIPDDRLDVLPMTPLCMACHYNAQNCAVARDE